MVQSCQRELQAQQTLEYNLQPDFGKGAYCYISKAAGRPEVIDLAEDHGPESFRHSGGLKIGCSFSAITAC